jgi:CDP-diacylglycerol--glycerol-3-phosphate 3-phosphatidyltransferase
MIPFFILFFYLSFTAHYFVALAVFGAASLTDFFDGKLARKYNLVTNLGKFLDPIADKVLVLSAFVVFLTKAQIFTAELGDWAIIVAGCGVAIILAREIIVSGFRMVAANSGKVIAADKVGKYKTATQDFSIVILLLGEGVRELTTNIAGAVINYVGLGLFALAVVLTVISGINYIVKNIDVLRV